MAAQSNVSEAKMQEKNIIFWPHLPGSPFACLFIPLELHGWLIYYQHQKIIDVRAVVKFTGQGQETNGIEV